MRGEIKEAFFIRHAKSSWDNANISDIERPLNDRGHDIAPKMASFIQSIFNLSKLEIISSPAKRARSTARYFADRFGMDKSDIIIDDNLYYGSEWDYLKCLQVLHENAKAVFVFGHNPTIELVVSKLDNPYHGLVPTCAVFHTQLKTKTWNVNQFNELKLVNHYFPKVVLT